MDIDINIIVLIVVLIVVVAKYGKKQLLNLFDNKMNKKQIILGFSAIIIIGLLSKSLRFGNDSTKNKENISKTNEVSSKTNEVSSKEASVHYAVTKHRLDGDTVYATAYVSYSINAEYCARDVQGVAYSLMKDRYKTASTLVLEYGIKRG